MNRGLTETQQLEVMKNVCSSIGFLKPFGLTLLTFTLTRGDSEQTISDYSTSV